MIPFRKTALPTETPAAVMAHVYAALQTPVKHGAVMKPEHAWTDSPSVFRYGGRFYKSFLFRDDARVTGFPFVNAYNAKGQDNRERIFLAASEDGEHFQRYGDRAVPDASVDDPATCT